MFFWGNQSFAVVVVIKAGGFIQTVFAICIWLQAVFLLLHTMCVCVLLICSHSNVMKIPEGWLNYLSPEVIKALRVADPGELTVKLPFSKQSDVFAFG